MKADIILSRFTVVLGAMLILAVGMLIGIRAGDNKPAALNDGCGVDKIRVCTCVPPGMSYGSN